MFNLKGTSVNKSAYLKKMTCVFQAFDQGCSLGSKASNAHLTFAYNGCMNVLQKGKTGLESIGKPSGQLKFIRKQCGAQFIGIQTQSMSPIPSFEEENESCNQQELFVLITRKSLSSDLLKTKAPHSVSLNRRVPKHIE